MKTFRSSKLASKSVRKPVIVLGNFDGVHLAHQKMFSWANEIAQKKRAKVLIYTFYPHPATVLAHENAPRMIMTLPQKIEVLKTLKIPWLVVEPFDKSFADQKPEDWFHKVIVERLHAQDLVAGYDFTFGKRRSGNVKLLEELCDKQGISCHIMKPFLEKQTLVSSSHIRHLVEIGKMADAEKLLGRPYFMDGIIIKGKGRGRVLGIPTANLKSENTLTPCVGVYATAMKVGKKTFTGVTNVGFNPTFGDTPLSIETFVFHFKGSLYGKKVRLLFLHHIRGEQKFSSLVDLKKQIEQDINTAKKWSLPFVIPAKRLCHNEGNVIPNECEGS